MFKLNLESVFRGISFYDENMQLRFDPPVYEQRYSTIIRLLELDQWSDRIKKVVEFGCAEMKLLVLLKTLNIEQITQVDINEELLIRNKHKGEPLLINYLNRRSKPLCIDIYKGNIAAPHECLLNADVVICIEIIEHLYPTTLEDVPFNIFGFMKPNVVVFTTPNVEFNVLFLDSKFENGFRHDDHKFEWTREQFQDWTNNICDRYPDYRVYIYGIAPGPEGSAHLGCVTQMALFIRNDFIQNDMNTDENEIAKFDVENSSTSFHNENINSIHDTNIKSDIEISSSQICLNYSMTSSSQEDLEYKIICSYNYPVNCDNRSKAERILDEAKYQLGLFMNMEEEFYDSTADIFLIPVKLVFDLLFKETEDIDEFKSIMTSNSYKINENDNFEIKPDIRDISNDEISDDEKYRYDTQMEDIQLNVVEEEEMW